MHKKFKFLEMIAKDVSNKKPSKKLDKAKPFKKN